MNDISQIFDFSIPRTFIGAGAGERLSTIIKEAALENPLIVTDNYLSKTPILTNILDSLNQNGVTNGIFTHCKPDAPFSIIEQCRKMFLENKHDSLIAIGGGSVLDTAKAVSVVAAGNGHSIDDCLGLYKVDWTAIPTVLIPTTAGTGSEWTWVAVVTDDSQGIKRTIYSYSLRPLAVIVDPVFTAELPKNITAETGMDALVHGIEGYTSRKANIISEMFAEKSIELVYRNLQSAYNLVEENLEVRYNVAIGATLAASFIFSGLGLAHAMAYPMQMTAHISHGASCSIMLPYIMNYNIVACKEKYARIATLMGQDVKGKTLHEQAQMAIDAVKKLSEVLEMPQRMRDVGIRQEQIPGFANNVLKYQPHVLASNPRNADKDALTAIYENAL